MNSTFAFSQSVTTSERTTLHTIELCGPAGRLEGLLNQGAPGSRFAALVCHPHPQGGGTLHNKVVYHAMKVLNAPEWGFRLPVLRFNFRGTGISEGRHDGVAEAADVTAALDWLNTEYKLPIIVAGFSFGAAMALVACCEPASAEAGGNIRALAALGLPTQAYGHRFHYPFLGSCSIPKLFLSGDRDRFAPEDELRQLVDTAAHPKHLSIIPGADHSFSGRVEAMQQSLARWLKEQVQ